MILVFWPCRPFYDLKVKLGHGTIDRCRPYL
jgi:hypothetical protein